MLKCANYFILSHTKLVLFCISIFSYKDTYKDVCIQLCFQTYLVTIYRNLPLSHKRAFKMNVDVLFTYKKVGNLSFVWYTHTSGLIIFVDGVNSEMEC